MTATDDSGNGQAESAEADAAGHGSGEPRAGFEQTKTLPQSAFDEARLPWSAAGRAPAVLLIHGFTGNPYSMRQMGEHIAAAGYAVEVVRLPGHGTSVLDMAKTRYEDWRGEAMRVARQLADDHGDGEVVLVGLSMGATIAVDLASSLTSLVGGVVAINGQFDDPQEPLARAAGVLQYIVPFVPRGLAGLPADDIKRAGATEHGYDLVPAKAARSLMRHLPRIRSQLLHLTQPLLVVSSRVDHTVDPSNSDTLAAMARNAEVERLHLEDSYHVATLDNDAPLLREHVTAFIGRVASQDS